MFNQEDSPSREMNFQQKSRIFWKIIDFETRKDEPSTKKLMFN